MSRDRDLQAWLGRSQHREERLTEAIVDGLNALLDRDGGSPPGLHWLLCQDRVRQSELGDDGHARRGGFLPPVALPRRMWAAGEIRFTGRAASGQHITRESVIAGIEQKQGASGALVFVQVDHRYRADRRPWLEERHTIVYREAPRESDKPRPLELEEAPDDGLAWRITTDPVQLFRYSALMFNAHRIHYDHPYATDIEGYPGVVVHGPLLATWLMDFAERRMGVPALRTFSFRIHAPVFAGETITLFGRESDDGLDLAVLDGRRRRVVEARAVPAPA